MNVFFLSPDPVQCAAEHPDKHVLKMIVEYAQILSTAHRILDGKMHSTQSATGRKKNVWVLPDARQDLLYATTHVNHPCAVWARASAGNYSWLAQLLLALCDEYATRYGAERNRVHRVQGSGLAGALQHCPQNIPDAAFSEPAGAALAMPVQYKVANAVQSYRNYYLAEKRRLLHWKNKCVPAWVVDEI